MTKVEAKQKLEDCVSNRDMKEIGGKYCAFYAVYDLIDEIYNDFDFDIKLAQKIIEEQTKWK